MGSVSCAVLETASSCASCAGGGVSGGLRKKSLKRSHSTDGPNGHPARLLARKAVEDEGLSGAVRYVQAGASIRASSLASVAATL